MKLYSYYRSSCSYRVRIALNLKGIDYEYAPIHLVKDGGQQYSDSYSERNPGQKVPTLESPNGSLGESVAIIEYLEELHPKVPLFPKDPLEKAQMRQCIEVVNSGIQPLQNLAVLIKLKKDLSMEPHQVKKWIQHWITSGFVTLEKLLQKKEATAFSFGNTPSALDCYIIPQVYNAIRFEVDMALFPRIKAIDETALKHPAFEKAHPSKQPDAPKD